MMSAGQIASTFSENSKQYDVIIRAEEQYRRDRSNFKYFTVGSSNGGTVDLERVVKIDEGLSPSSINRLNRLRQVTVSAGLQPNTSESDAVAKMQKIAADLKMPAEYLTGVTGQSKELEKAYNAFLYAFLLSFVFMYLILAAQFESFIHPVTRPVRPKPSSNLIAGKRELAVWPEKSRPPLAIQKSTASTCIKPSAAR